MHRPPRQRRPGRREPPIGPREALSIAQGAYYATTGVWPLLHMRSFEAVTGPKTDRWLVHTVGALAAGVGIGLVRAGLRRRVTPEIRLIAGACAAGFAGVDVRNALRGRISDVYLLDAIAEAAILAALAGTAGGRTRGG